MSCVSHKLDTIVNHVHVVDSWRRNGEEQFPDVKEKDETWREMNGDTPREKASISLVKGLTHSGSGVLLAYCLLQ